MLRILIYALPIVLAVYALVDLVQTRDEDVQGLPKLVWVLLIVLVWVVGPARLAVRRPQGPAASPGSRRAAAGPAGGRPGRWRRTTTPTSCAASTGRSARPRTTSPPPVR